MEILIEKSDLLNMSTCWVNEACNGDTCNPD